MSADIDAAITKARDAQLAAIWPGFDPRDIPVVIYAGERTLLFGHPDPPQGFVHRPGGELHGWAYPGLYPAVRANSVAEIGGALAATLMVDPRSIDSAAQLASIVVHEAFHVFQRRHHPAWAANESDLFTYPVLDAALLAERRLETEALRRALAAGSAERLTWVTAAAECRRRRFAALPPDSIAYERGNELQEGLAEYVERQALARLDPVADHPPDLPQAGLAPDAVRQRCYAVGHALAVLLDALRPGWIPHLAAHPPAALDQCLHAVVARRRSDTNGFSREERDAARQRAEDDVAALERERRATREAFLGVAGWRLELHAPETAPLALRGLDPSNVTCLDEHTVLHGRYLKLHHPSGDVEILGGRALTLAAGDHPLHSGVRRLIMTGLKAEPVIERRADATHIRADGLTASVWRAAVEKRATTWVVTLAPS